MSIYGQNDIGRQRMTGLSFVVRTDEVKPITITSVHKNKRGIVAAYYIQARGWDCYGCGVRDFAGWVKAGALEKPIAETARENASKKDFEDRVADRKWRGNAEAFKPKLIELMAKTPKQLNIDPASYSDEIDFIVDAVRKCTGLSRRQYQEFLKVSRRLPSPYERCGTLFAFSVSEALNKQPQPGRRDLTLKIDMSGLRGTTDGASAILFAEPQTADENSISEREGKFLRFGIIAAEFPARE
jgi:hypothetical protein